MSSPKAMRSSPTAVMDESLGELNCYGISLMFPDDHDEDNCLMAKERLRINDGFPLPYTTAFPRFRCLIIRLALISSVLWMTSVENVLSQNSADIMHKPRVLQKRDLLLRVFGKTLTAVKKKDWRAVPGTIEKIHAKVDDYKKYFGIDLKPRIDEAVMTKRSDQLLKLLAQTIYFGMKMQFKTILDAEMRDYLDSKTRLDRAEGYYEKILSGNVKRKKPMAHQKIQEQFILAEAALGSPRTDEVSPKVPANLKGFERAISNIEKELTAVYTYFMKKEKL